VGHRNPEFWESPTTFEPERFTAERIAKRPRYAYFPFGGGPRHCIGHGFAMMEAQFIVAQMAQKLRPRRVQGHPVEPRSATTLRPRHGLVMTLELV
jgi:cytochrome P450